MKVIRHRKEEVTVERIAGIVHAGDTAYYFDVGDQIVATWTDDDLDDYELPFDIVDFQDVELEDGSTVPGMILQMHYALPFDVPFAACGSDTPNRWDKSLIRQYLNGKGPAGKWWAPASDGEELQDNMFEKGGFMAGFAGEFLSMLKPVKIQTALANGEMVTTYDTFFLPSLSQMGISEYEDGEKEGKTWEYWDFPEDRHEKFMDLDGEDCCVRLRSARRTTAGSTWIVTTTGRAYGYGAAFASRFCAACVIC